ncbi:hypothetical protein PAXRUDRAFT_36911 [Paxillus rubicundulus Ve08.2h10]|uniref:Gfo/Idh/MocA-like oxidoreductase N-terminal domain-containing protein n=1 Tax=Paxillus rubicundulus Ve08.2h10 TaxID=930991 RepID=A0A0D0CMM1_9AGAM|nr:hypothetical protein PAXRUDRAFT_36911 [Paxillus rubicundulus Ve08.2h10]
MPTASNAGVAILGSGMFAKEALGPLAPKLKAVYSRSEKCARELADEAAAKLRTTPQVYHDRDPSINLDVLLARSNISIVIVVLPITLQPSIVLKALKAGKHIISEKRVAPDNWEAVSVYAAAAKAIRAGKIGKVIFFSLRAVSCIDQDAKWYKTPWRTIPDYQGGFLHSVAALRVILPSTMAYLSGFASLNVEWLAQHDTINAIIRSADGSRGIFELSFGATTPSREAVGNGIVITGTDGHLTVNRTEVRDPVTGTDKSKSIICLTIKSTTRGADGKPDPEQEEVNDEPARGIELELAAFFAAVLEGKYHGLGCPMGALRDMAFIEAALISGGKLIDLEKLVGRS